LQHVVDPDSLDPYLSLLRRTVDGDREAFAALFDFLAPKTLGLLIQILRHRTVAEEVLHDVFLQVWRHADLFSPERGSVRSWIYTIARSQGLDRLRRERASKEEEKPGAVLRAVPVGSPATRL
jgi:RNA polymerase sigma-70 factor, ECF subfamily